jgi:hypothetical protein
VADPTDRDLRLDVRAEALVDGVVVASGELDDVAASRRGSHDASAFQGAIEQTVALAASTAAVPGGAIRGLRLSVRRTCARQCSHHAPGPDAGTPRIWFDGAPQDTGAGRGAGSRYTIRFEGEKTTRYLRSEGPLAIPVLGSSAGAATRSLDTFVDSTEPCPDRTFTEVATWSEVPDAFACTGTLDTVLRDPVTGRSLVPLQERRVEERVERVTALYFNFSALALQGNIFFSRFGVQPVTGLEPRLVPSGPKACDALGTCTQAHAVDVPRFGPSHLATQDRPCSDLNTQAGQFTGRVCFPSPIATVHVSGVLTTRPGAAPWTFTFDEDYETAGYYGGIPGFFLTDETHYAVKCSGRTITVRH